MVRRLPVQSLQRLWNVQRSPARLHSTGGSGRVLTEAVLQTQRDTINAITVIADELKQIRVVLCDIASTLKDQVKK